MLKISNFTKRYGALTVFENFNLEIADGTTLALLGDSGVGKTTLLTAVAKLTDYEGEILPATGRVSYVFQTDRLVPHMTVLENLTLVAPQNRAKEYLERAGLTEFSAMYPRRLSAGMARRVAVLRAFLFDAPLMLMDEPFRNLDLSLRYKLMDFYKQLAADNPRTTVFVTHDVKEAAYLADRAVVIGRGGIIADIKNTDPELTEKKLIKLFIDEK